MRILLIITATLTISFGEVITDSLRVDGYTRTYHVYIPTAFEPGLPMVFNLHGYGSHGLEEMEYTGMNSVADTANFIVVYPEAIDNRWNSGISDNPEYPTPDVDDVAFLSALIDTIHSDYQVNTDQVYSCGWSNGGRMSLRLSAEIPEQIRAVASVSGKLTETIANACDSSGTVPILYMHGTDDPISYYYEEQTGNYLPEDAVAFWVEMSGCSVDGDTVLFPDVVPSDGCMVDVITYPSPSDTVDVIFLKIKGGGHTWPGGTFTLPSLGNTCYDFNASEMIWNFFMNDSFEVKSHIWARSMELGPSLYMEPGSDSLHIVCDFYNKDNHVFTAFAILENSQGTTIDSFELVDDGICDDGIAGNNICGGYIGTQATEDFYLVHAHSHDAETGDKFIMKDQATFTTAGPVVLEDLIITYDSQPSPWDTLPTPGSNIKFNLVMKNSGGAATIPDLTLLIATEDSNVQIVQGNKRDVPNLEPGEIAENSSDFYMKILASHPENSEVIVQIDIASDGIHYWSDSCSIPVGSSVAIDDLKQLPVKYAIYQNHPNPFNPITTIPYDLPNTSDVTLQIYDITGRLVETLINQQQNAGNYQVQWDASGYSSGVYFYRIQVTDPDAVGTDGFQQVWKMVLVK